MGAVNAIDGAAAGVVVAAAAAAGAEAVGGASAIAHVRSEDEAETKERASGGSKREMKTSLFFFEEK